LARSYGLLLPRLVRRCFSWMDQSYRPRAVKPSLPRKLARAIMRRRYQANR
jgi:hypothetical protein